MEQALKNMTFGKALMFSCGLTLIYYFFMYNDGSLLVNNISKAQGEIQKNRAELASIKKAEEDAARYEATMKELGDDMAKVVRALPTELTPLELTKLISLEAQTAGLQIVKLSPQQGFRESSGKQGGSNAFYETIDVDVELSGAYPQIMLFISNLTKLDKIITAQSLEMSLRSGSSLKGNISPTITYITKLTAYRYVPPKADPPKGAGNATR